MPVKNTGKFLKDCVDSIIDQSLTDWKLIAIDDNSTDNSYELLLAYGKKDDRIKVFKNDGKGIISALRLAYKKSSGCYITRMDSDDIMGSHKLSLLYDKLQSIGNGHVAIGLVHYFSEGELGEGYANYATWLNKLTCSESNFSGIYKECSIPSPCWMVSRIDLEASGGFQSDIYPEDYDLAFRFRKAGLKIATVKKEIHQWRDYETRTSRTDKNYTDNTFSALKIFHFLEQDYISTSPLVLWGAGKKGKKIASILSEKNIHFIWICNNSNKIGREIYGTYLQELDELTRPEKVQVIVAVSSPLDSGEIEKMIAKNQQHQYFRFC